MADRLARHYHLLEPGVTEKTAELQRSNRSLEPLTTPSPRLYQAPSAPTTPYEATLRDIDRVAGLEGSFVCIRPRPAPRGGDRLSSWGPVRIAPSAARTATQPADPARGQALASLSPTCYTLAATRNTIAKKHAAPVAVRRRARLEDWQRQPSKTLSRHIGMMLGAAAHRAGAPARTTGGALGDRASCIDSLAQALSPCEDPGQPVAARSPIRRTDGGRNRS